MGSDSRTGTDKDNEDDEGNDKGYDNRTDKGNDGRIRFWINNEQHEVDDADPRMLLLDYLRSDEVGLTGTKKVCAQGGCGACTVTLTRWSERTQRLEQTAVNSCLRPLCAVDGMAVTTIEGIGGATTELSPVQYQVAIDNGSQCGFCTPGWVMNMHSFLVANEGRDDITQDEIEQLFDGNLCRCTGYRPILFAMRHFASGWAPCDEQGSLTCLPIPGEAPAVAAAEPNPVPVGIRRGATRLRIEKDGDHWLRVLSLDELDAVRDEYGSVDDLKLIVGNTSIGIYGEPAQDVSLGRPHVRVDISEIPELHGFHADANGFTVGAATTYTDFIRDLDALAAGAVAAHRSGIEAIRYMAHRTAGRIVRDAASLGGNTMLVVRNIDVRGVTDGRAPSAPRPAPAPFPSDMFTALCMMDAAVDVTCRSWDSERRLPVLDFAELWRQDEELQRSGLLLRYHVPLTGEGEFTRTYKVALREVNSHSIVNAGLRVRFDDDQTVAHVSAVFGGIGPIAFHATGLERELVGRRWDDGTLADAMRHLRLDVLAEIDRSEERMRLVPDEGFTDEYRLHLAESFLYQYFVWVAEKVESGAVGPSVRSAGVRMPRPVSKGAQKIETDPAEYPVSFPFVKVGAFLQASGEAIYTHDTPPDARGVEAALVVSAQALNSYQFVVQDDDCNRKPASTDELAAALASRFPGFVDLVTAADIPGTNNQAPHGAPFDPLICEGVTTACGQVLAIVLADTHQRAIDIAWWVQTYCVEYGPAPYPYGEPQEPVLTLDESIAKQNYIPEQSYNIFEITRAGSDLSWCEETQATVDGIECSVVGGAQMSRTPQMHFYMETQSAVATPGENRQMSVLSSTQNPSTIHGAVTSALGLSSNEVDVQITRVGGGYGGKGPRSPWAAANAAIAAAKIGRSVKLAVTRETDSALFGHENPLLGEYSVAIGTGRDADGHDDPHSLGRLMGVQAHLSLDAGNTADASPVVLDCVQLRFDNAYLIPNYRTDGRIYLTNTISNTSFRSLNAVSGITILEDGIEAAAHELGLLPEDVRAKNLYELGDSTPYGEVLDYCYLRDVWEYTKQRADFEVRLEAVQHFNRDNRWLKRGISMIPIKYGMGFNTASMERGDALVDIYEDGSVIVRHGGAEIGQGLNTQVTQLVAQALRIPMDLVRIGTTSTAVIPNPISTGASTGTAFNGGAAQKAATTLRERLEAFCLGLLAANGRQWCTDHHVDFWNYDDGWQTLVGTDPGGPRPMWTYIVSQAGSNRVDLSAQAQHDETGGTRADTGVINDVGGDPGAQNFVGYTYSAACTEVEVNILTGEVQILRADLVYDMGKSINPATDVGQVEGAFMQGVGRVLLEDIVWQSTGPNKGLNNTPNTWGYKIPASTTVPLELNVDLYPREASSEVPDNPNLLMSAKEVGEPPLCLATTVYFAVKHAILDSLTERGKPGWFRLDMPCTVQRVREACDVTADELSLAPPVNEPPAGPIWRRLPDPARSRR